MDDEAGVGTVSGRLEKEDKKMKTVDMELIFLCALMAAIGADGHKPEHIAYDFGKVNDVLKACGFKYYTEFEERKPIFKQLT